MGSARASTVALATCFALVACNAVLGNEVTFLDPGPPLSPANPGACANDCDGEPVGATRCAATGGGVDVCVRGASGCPAWRNTFCAKGTCDPADPSACAGPCANTCAQEGATKCEGAAAQRACLVTGACLAWGPPEACPAAQSCFGNACAAACTSDPECPAAGVKVCASAGTFRVCAEAAPGCLKLGAPQSCPSGEACSGAGVCSCPGCTQGGSCFPGTSTAACGKGGACAKCASGESCTNAVCREPCAYGGQQFAPGQRIKIGSLCYRWNGNGTTPYGTCQSNIAEVPCP
ncbi:MAG TPA: hypothetical protein PLR99_22280 [Polyangiaceae bacterium]|jgi:hypothetical protein|nr:hypothetical protein [Polyangiaceae bacterium]